MLLNFNDMAKKIYITREQLKILQEETVNISAQAKTNNISDFASAVSNADTQSDIQKAGSFGDVNLTVTGPNNDSNQPQQMINVSAGDTIQNAINTQANDTIIRNGGSLKITGDGINETVTISKKDLDKAYLKSLKNRGKKITKKQLKEEIFGR